MRSEIVRDLVLRALAGIFDEQKPAERVLERTLRAHRELGSAERAAVARRVLGIACFRARLEHLIPQAGAGEAARHRWLLAAYLIDQERAEVPEAASASGLSEGEVSHLAAAGSWPSEPVDRLAAERSLPRWLADLWIEQLGAPEADRLAEAMNRPGPITARANTLRCSRDELVERLAQEGIAASPARWSPDGLHLSGRPNVFGSQAWREGLFEIQDEGSQLIAQLAAPRPGERCIDFCAGAGGKTLALAALMRDQGELWALDVNEQRLADMRPRLARAGASIVRPLAMEPQGALPEQLEPAEVVLVDAPCSSLGTLRRGPDSRWRTRPDDVAAFPELQHAILERAARYVRPGGRLVYATCTINRGENEEVAARFQQSHPGFEPAQPPPGFAGPLCPDGAMRLFPHIHGTDGFFACAWRRRRDHEGAKLR
ncbi:MAG: RsmB/NOP family class I SAM-dependent RNA methyltransferase [Myxococcales bacterium]